MTREEAIRELKILKNDYWDDDGYGHETQQYNDTMLALDMAIKALEQEPCADAIGRQAVLDKKELVELEDGQSFYCISPEDVETLSPVNPQPKIGHWIFDEILDRHYYCSECKSMGVDYWDYCPNCGAKMEEVEE